MLNLALAIAEGRRTTPNPVDIVIETFCEDKDDRDDCETKAKSNP